MEVGEPGDQVVGTPGPEASQLGLATGGGPVHAQLAESPWPPPAVLPGV